MADSLMAGPREKAIGFVGLGHMGGAIARRLLKAGVPLIVHDLEPAAVARLVEAGATAAASVGQMADATTVVFMCLPSPESSLAVARQLAGGRAIRLVVETSTVGPRAIEAMALELAATGVRVADSPVSGGPRAAEAGTLSVMVAAEAEVMSAIAPLLDAISQTRFHVGPKVGQAQLCKLINNAISAAGMIAACQATVLGAKAGLDSATMLAAINAGSGRNAATQDKFPAAILPGSFNYGGPLGLMLKDLSLYLAEAQSFGVPGTVAAAALAEWQQAEQRTGFHADYSEVIRHLEADAHAFVRATPE